MHGTQAFNKVPLQVAALTHCPKCNLEMRLAYLVQSDFYLILWRICESLRNRYLAKLAFDGLSCLWMTHANEIDHVSGIVGVEIKNKELGEV